MIEEAQDAICVSLEVLRQADGYYRWLADRVRPYVRGKALEVGAGIGNFAKWIQDAADEYHVTDVDPRLLKTLEQNFNHAFLWDVYEPFPRSDTYDAIVTINVVEHLQDDVLALRAMYDRLVPGGHLVVIVPAMQWLYGSLDRSFGHFRRYTKRSMARVLEQANFRMLTQYYVNVIGMMGWFLYARILKRPNLPEGLCSHFNVLMPLFKLERPVAHFMGLSLVIIGQKKNTEVQS